VDAGSQWAEWSIDGLSGASLTADGVSNMVRYWLGEQGFGPFLARLREGGA
jgi:Na+-transporting NADH:ubiquinone oxidoreductase subunit C